MAALTTAQRRAVRAKWMSDISARREACPLTKPQLEAYFDAIDNWIEANAASFNAALPLPGRTAFTAAQKAEHFYLVALKRFGG